MRPNISMLALVALGFSTLFVASSETAMAQAATSRPATSRPAPSTRRDRAEALRQERAKIREQIEDLASADFEVRKRAAQKLEAYGRKARALLQETVNESEDAEQVWQARRLLRRIEKGRPALKSGARRQSRSGATRRSKIDPKARSKADADADADSDADADADSDAKADAEATAKAEARGWGFPGGFGRKFHSEGTIVKMGPEGVEVDITITEDGKKRRKNYKAKTMEELLEKYPALKDKVGGFSLKGRMGFGPGMLRGMPFDWSPLRGTEIEDMEKQIERMERRLRELMRGDLGEAHRGHLREDLPKGLPPKSKKLKSMPSSGPKLGIFVGRGETSSVSRFLGLPEGVGLWVEGLQEGSSAERLGLAKGDFLVKLDGQWIRGPEDVARILASKQARKLAGKRGNQKAKTKLQAQWYRKGRKMQKAVGF